MNDKKLKSSNLEFNFDKARIEQVFIPVARNRYIEKLETVKKLFSDFKDIFDLKLSQEPNGCIEFSCFNDSENTLIKTFFEIKNLLNETSYFSSELIYSEKILLNSKEVDSALKLIYTGVSPKGFIIKNEISCIYPEEQKQVLTFIFSYVTCEVSI